MRHGTGRPFVLQQMRRQINRNDPAAGGYASVGQQKMSEMRRCRRQLDLLQQLRRRPQRHRASGGQKRHAERGVLYAARAAGAKDRTAYSAGAAQAQAEQFSNAGDHHRDRRCRSGDRSGGAGHLIVKFRQAKARAKREQCRLRCQRYPKQHRSRHTGDERSLRRPRLYAHLPQPAAR